jgi:hypothetical protein
VGRLAEFGDPWARDLLYDLVLHGSGSPRRPPWSAGIAGIEEQAATYLAEASDARVADILEQHARLRSAFGFSVFADEMHAALAAALGLVRLGDTRGADRLAALAADLRRITRSTDQDARYEVWFETVKALADLGDPRAADLAAAFVYEAAAEPRATLSMIRTLAAQHDPRVLDMLSGLLSTDMTEDLWEHAAALLTDVERDEQRRSDVLRRIAEDPKSAGSARLYAAAESLRSGRESRGGALLAAVAQDPTVDGLQRHRAAVLLAGLDERTPEILYAISMDDTVDAMIRANAARELAEAGDARARDALAAALAAAAFPGARDHAIRAMQEGRWALARRELRARRERLANRIGDGTSLLEQTPLADP